MVIQLNDNEWGAAEQNLQAAVRDPAYPPAYVVLGMRKQSKRFVSGDLSRAAKTEFRFLCKRMWRSVPTATNSLLRRRWSFTGRCCAGREVARPGRENLCHRVRRQERKEREKERTPRPACLHSGETESLPSRLV